MTTRKKRTKTTTFDRSRLPAPEPLLFLGLSPAECPLSRARVVFVPAPFDQTTSYMPGTRFGPRAILEASRQVEFYDEELDLEPYHIGIATLGEIQTDPLDCQGGLDRLEAVVSKLADSGAVPFTLGGEHSLTIAPVRALRQRYPELSVLQLDAHLDLRAEYQGTKHSHASVMRRVRELGVPTVPVGIRSVSREEAEYVHAENAPVFLAREIRRDGLPVDRILDSLRNPVYISIDLDAFDPAYVPGVGTPEPGGLAWEEGLRLLRAVCERRQVVGCDLVELRPIEGQPASDFFAAKLANKLLGYLGFSLDGDGDGNAKSARHGEPGGKPRRRVTSLRR